MALKTPLIPDEPGDFPISRFATFDYQRDPEGFLLWMRVNDRDLRPALTAMMPDKLFPTA
jgi:hypothetical protein